MTSLAKIAANRANARKSTGPKTAAGKARVARNGQNSQGPRTAAGKRAAAANSTGPKTPAGKRRAAQNSQKSTGPKTEAGKKRIAQNALRHGLTRATTCEPDAASTTADFAQAIANESGRRELLSTALRIAAAQFDLLRVRRARHSLLGRGMRDQIRRLAALQRYEAHARRLRKTAVRDLQSAQLTNQSKLTKAKSDKTK
jgi:hypothetical protein